MHCNREPGQNPPVMPALLHSTTKLSQGVRSVGYIVFKFPEDMDDDITPTLKESWRYFVLPLVRHAGR